MFGCSRRMVLLTHGIQPVLYLVSISGTRNQVPSKSISRTSLTPVVNEKAFGGVRLANNLRW